MGEAEGGDEAVTSVIDHCSRIKHQTDKILRAASFASTAHIGQVRKYTGDPYITHPISVAIAVSERTSDEDAICAALLHDVVEDTEVTPWQVMEHFGKSVSDLVQELTDVYTREAYPSMNRRARKIAETQRLAGISDRAKLIKVCDIADNTSSIVQYDPGFAVVYLEEKAAMLAVLTSAPLLHPG